MRLLLLTFCLFALTGCARYEFDIIEPGDLAGRVGRKAESAVQFERQGVRYRMQAEGRLVMQLFNDGDEAIDLVGDRSYVVDPDGESHPIRQAIAPKSFIKLILPPMPRVYRASPGVGFGVGIGISRHYRRHHWGHFHGAYYDPFYDPFYDRPLYLAVYGDEATWSWQGETRVQMRLTFRSGGQLFHQDFVIQRVKL